MVYKNTYILTITLLFLVTGSLKAQSEILIFGKNPKIKTGNIISSPISYNDETGYGFDYGTGNKIEIKKQSFNSATPVYFSVKVPEGNYRVNIIFNHQFKALNTTLKAESRRLMLKNIVASKDKDLRRTFLVNVRTPFINEESSINIKARETNYLNWDNKLTLEFLGETSVKSIEVVPEKDCKTIFLAGDSTVTDQDYEPWASWGQFITSYFSDEVVFANYAASGASLASFEASNRLQKILSVIQPNDYLFIEFGHNDEKQKGENDGPWKSYTKLLKEYIEKARSKGGIPVLITPVQRRVFKTQTNTLEFTHGDYPDAVRAVAEELNVPLIDLTRMTTVLYEAWGNEESRKAFVQYPENTFPGQNQKLEDNTHFNSFGGNEIALCVIKGIIDLKLDLSNYLQETINYNPANPNKIDAWTLPVSQRFENVKPDGN